MKPVLTSMLKVMFIASLELAPSARDIDDVDDDVTPALGEECDTAGDDPRTLTRGIK